MFILEIKGILLHFGPKTEGTLVILLPKFKGKFILFGRKIEGTWQKLTRQSPVCSLRKTPEAAWSKELSSRFHDVSKSQPQLYSSGQGEERLITVHPA